MGNVTTFGTFVKSTEDSLLALAETFKELGEGSVTRVTLDEPSCGASVIVTTGSVELVAPSSGTSWSFAISFSFADGAVSFSSSRTSEIMQVSW